MWGSEMKMATYTYRTDAVHCDTQYPSAEAAIAAAIEAGDWDEIDSARESRYIADGAWLCVYSDGVPEVVRGTMP